MGDSITIDGFTFTILPTILPTHPLPAKIINEHGRIFVHLQSLNNSDETIYDFWVYSSTSELGMWRICLINGQDYYKGNPKLDYVQTTLVHLDLQHFINNHQGDYTQMVGSPCEVFTNLKSRDAIRSTIDEPKRVIMEEPFASFHRLIKCNEYYARKPNSFNMFADSHVTYNGKQVLNDPQSLLFEFSELLRIQYMIGEIRHLYDYKNIFEQRLNTTGHIGSVTLHRRDLSDESKTNDVILYYYYVNQICDITPPSAGINTWYEERRRPGLKKSCDNTPFVMPVLLTIPGVKCNHFGLNEMYIPSGPFICKMFDYSKQCTRREVDTGACNSTYSLIGHRLQGVFPFNGIVEAITSNLGSNNPRKSPTTALRMGSISMSSNPKKTSAPPPKASTKRSHEPTHSPPKKTRKTRKSPTPPSR